MSSQVLDFGKHAMALGTLPSSNIMIPHGDFALCSGEGKEEDCGELRPGRRRCWDDPPALATHSCSNTCCVNVPELVRRKPNTRKLSLTLNHSKASMVSISPTHYQSYQTAGYTTYILDIPYMFQHYSDGILHTQNTVTAVCPASDYILS